MSSITNPLSSSSLQSIISSALQGVSQTNKPGSLKNLESVSSTQQPDSASLSPFAQMLTQLQQLQQSDPTKYKEVTQQISTNLQSAANTAQSNGNTAAADRLTQLSNDFSKASSTGDLPNIGDLAKAVGGHHHGGHRMHPVNTTDTDGDSSSTTGTTGTTGVTTSSSSAMQTLQTLLQTLEANQPGTGQGGSSDPANIIMNTLANSGMDV